MYIYAHRGFSGEYPENTMIAFQQAYDLGVDGIELDVQMTKDGELVVIHDERIERTTDGIGYVKDFSYRQLCRFDAGSWFHPRFAGERIPALTDVLDWLANQKRSIVLSIELKNGIIQYDGMEEKLLTLLDSYCLWNHHVIISSFSIQSLYKMRQLAKDINLALLVEGTEQNVLDVARSLNVKEVHVDWTFFISAEGEKVRQEVDTCVYTINEVSLLNKLIGSGVKAIMTDFPDRMIRR